MSLGISENEEKGTVVGCITKGKTKCETHFTDTLLDNNSMRQFDNFLKLHVDFVITERHDT